MRPGAPLRFLGLVLVGWVGLRIGLHAPGWLGTSEASDSGRPGHSGPASLATEARVAARLPIPIPARPFVTPAGGAPERPPVVGAARFAPLVGPRQSPTWPVAPTPSTLPESFPFPSPHSAEAPFSAAPFALPTSSARSRWSGSAWLLLRREAGSPALAPGGSLSGSQAGARLLYRLTDDPARPLSLSARAYLPLRRPEGAEVALGLDWQPAAHLPIHLQAERRQAIGREGRSAFALTLYGGHSASLGRLRIDAYGQTGVVGLRARDLFADGALQVVVPIGPVEAGAGLWGAAQPGAARLDAGPQLALPLRIGRANLRLTTEYRFRVAGDAAPGSGPVLTLGSDF